MIASLEKFGGEIVTGAFIGMGMFAIGLVIFVIASVVERRHPIEPDQPRSEIILDYKLVFANVVLGRVFAPLSGWVVGMGISVAGGGFIPLRADGWWFALSLAIVVLAAELQGYWFHRLQHCVPLLWSMHSLHHSAEALTLATGARHYWLEKAIVFSFFPSVAMVFKIPPEVMQALPYCFLTENMAHMNIKVPFGPLVYVFNTPQFHRIHHSVDPQHYNKNFCKNLPIFDFIFGTALMPAMDVFLRTGLTNEKPVGTLEGLVWPLRHVRIVRRWLGAVSAVPRTTCTPQSSEVS